MAEPMRAGIHVEAPPERVFRYFCEPDAMLEWMGDRATLDAVAGGTFAVDVRGVAVRGEYVTVEPPHRLVFTWGHEGSKELPPGASVVEVRLTAARGGTNVVIEHRGLPASRAPGHDRGWSMFLGRLAAAVASGPVGEPAPPCTS